MKNNSQNPETLPKPETRTVTTEDQRLSIGLVSTYSDTDETRIMLTPEGCGMLVSLGYRVLVEKGAGIDISYSDEEYAHNGARLASREDTLQADIVITTEVPRRPDIMHLKRRATVLCFMDSPLFERERIQALLDREISLICLDNVISTNGEAIFAHIIDEIDGRAAVMYAQDELSFLGGGKGVLLAGAPGVNPCEVLAIGEGWRIVSAAAAAIAAGAKVTLMDNDVSALLDARAVCGEQLNITALHPRVVFNAVKGADIIFLDSCSREYEMPKEMSMAMKPNVYMLDFAQTHPSMSVPRTVAMAMSNLLVNFLHDLMFSGSTDNFITSTSGVQDGVVTYRGQLTNKLIGINTGIRSVDLQLITGPIN